MYFFFGILAVALGVLLIVKTEWFCENFGSIAWAEEHLGYNGGTRLMYKIIGLVFIFIGFLLVTNLFGGFIGGTIGKIFIRN
jgi:hypothetical protein